jgi:YVTN family beta-propeller protein
VMKANVTGTPAYVVGTAPAGIAFDGVNLWVANSTTNNVTKVTATGVAGGGLNPAQVATLHWYGANTGFKSFALGSGMTPKAVAFDGSNIWVANNAANSLKKVNPATGAVLLTVALPANAHPSALAFDGTNIWVADTGINKVTKVTASTGAVVASITVGSQPTGLAFDGALSKFGSPTSVPSPVLWVANKGGANLSKVNVKTGLVESQALAANTKPAAVAFDGTNIWSANSGTGNVSRVNTDTKVVTNFATGTTPSAVAFDGTNIWVANAGSNNVKELTLAGGTGGIPSLVRTIAMTPGTAPSGLAFDGANIWVTIAGASNNLKKISATSATAAVTGTFTVGSAPAGVAFDGVNVWSANATGNNITKVTATGVAGDGLNPAQVATLHWYPANRSYVAKAVGTSPQGVAFDGTNIWIANSVGNSVTKINKATGTTTTITTTSPAMAGPSGVAFDGTNIWVTERTGNKVTRLNAATPTTNPAHFPVGLSPAGVAFDGTNIWVANSGSNTVTKLLASTGAFLATATVGPNPEGIAFDGTNSGNGTASVVDPATATEIHNYPIPPSVNFGGPYGVAFDGTSMWFATGGHSVVKVAVAGATQTEYNVGLAPRALTFDGANIWVANFGSSDVTELVAATGALVAIYALGADTTPTVSTTNPAGIAFDGTNVWIANSKTNKASRL